MKVSVVDVDGARRVVVPEPNPHVVAVLPDFDEEVECTRGGDDFLLLGPCAVLFGAPVRDALRDGVCRLPHVRRDAPAQLRRVGCASLPPRDQYATERVKKTVPVGRCGEPAEAYCLPLESRGARGVAHGRRPLVYG